jgi:hypothetical protein
MTVAKVALRPPALGQRSLLRPILMAGMGSEGDIRDNGFYVKCGRHPRLFNQRVLVRALVRPPFSPVYTAGYSPVESRWTDAWDHP